MTPGVRIMFIDMNSFYASVEMQDNVGFRGKPTIVVPVMADNSCAIAASYQAKQLGYLKSSKDLIQPLFELDGLTKYSSTYEIPDRITFGDPKRIFQ